LLQIIYHLVDLWWGQQESENCRANC
jgi:hypothetical protein